MIDLRDVNNLFIQKIIAWLFGKSSSEGWGWGGCKSSRNLGGQSRNMLPFTKKNNNNNENQIIRIVISSIPRSFNYDFFLWVKRSCLRCSLILQ